MNIQHYWYRDTLHPLLFPLVPFSILFRLTTHIRRVLYQHHVKKSFCFSVPIIVVGNITVGGTGKTPFVIWLVNLLRQQGKKPGIASRGVGGKKNRSPRLVVSHSDPFEVGDEAVLLAQRTNCPIVTCIDRVTAVKKLIDAGCDIIVCDDGLQHYRLSRDIEIAIIDGDRYFGNKFLLPAGPLRESVSRLNEIDFIVVNQSTPSAQHIHAINTHPIQLKAVSFVSVHDETQEVDLSTFAGKKVHAVAGIGNPDRFFNTLRELGINILPHPVSDHHLYQSKDLDFQDNLPILMTEKDAVKCKKFAIQNQYWYLRIKMDVGHVLRKALLAKIEQVKHEISNTPQ